MDPAEKFNNEKKISIEHFKNDPKYQKIGIDFITSTANNKYSYNFSWMGRPIIAFPQDMIAMQEIIWEIKPDLIIETGIAHGGSIIYYASLLELIGGDGLVLGIDIDIREHNRQLIEKHPMFRRIKMIEGSSISEAVFSKVEEIAFKKKKVLVCLDSNHTHEHVIEELNLYAPLTSIGSYCVVFDTAIEDMPIGSFPNRLWDKGNNPKTAVWEYLNQNDSFIVDDDIHSKLLITVAPDGYLKRIK